MLGGSGPSIASQLLGIIQPKMKFPMLARHIPDGSDNLQKRRQRESVKKNVDDIRTCVQTKKKGGEVRPYQLRRLVEVMVAHVHPVLGHKLAELIV